MKATYYMLSDETWGIKVTDGVPSVGAVVTVEKRSGETKSETVQQVLRTRKGVSICSIVPTPRSSSTAKPKSSRTASNYDPNRFNGYGKKRGGFRKACVTGGNCSSFGSGRSCGGFGCDGWE